MFRPISLLASIAVELVVVAAGAAGRAAGAGVVVVEVWAQAGHGESARERRLFQHEVPPHWNDAPRRGRRGITDQTKFGQTVFLDG